MSNTGFRVRDNETREWEKGQYALFNKAGLHEVYGDHNQHTDDVSMTHTACFPVGETDKNGDDIYDGDNVKDDDGEKGTVTIHGITCTDGEFTSWREFKKLDFTLEIIPPTPKPKVLTWPELEDGTFFRFIDQQDKDVYRNDRRNGKGKFSRIDFMASNGGYENREHEPVTIVTPTWTEAD